MSTLSHDGTTPTPPDPAPPPPAPPLPPQRYGNRAANAIARFAQPFIYGSRPPIANGDRPSHPRSSGLRPRTSSPLSSKSTVHRTGIPIAALDVSPYGTHAVLAGRDILKTVQVSGESCAEDFNLRSHIVAYAATHYATGSAAATRHKDQLAANDVKWSNGRYDSTIATAAANGQIVIYDINRPGVEVARLHEHNRQVHRIAFNAHQGALLLSGSQDASVRLWDLRQLGDNRSVMTCGSVHKYSLNNEGIRDLRWSPTNGVEFAAGTDNGVVQRWDFRRDKSPLLKINAHEKTCHSLDWHPDGKHLVSAGADKNLKVWDFSSTDRRMKPCWQLRAPQAVLHVRWRPPCWTANVQGPGNWQAIQLATSYDQQDPRIHVWDLRRPFMPFREVDRYDTPATAMLWRSESLLWTVGIAGMFTQTDISHASKVLDKRSPNVIATASTGEISLFSEKRSRRRTSLDDVPDDFLQGKAAHNGSGEKFSSSHSTTDGSFEEPSFFLSTSFKSRQRKPASTRSTKSVASTPPSAGVGGPVLRLDESLQKDLLYRPAQLAASGYIAGNFDQAAFKYLAFNYRSPPIPPTTQSEWNLHEQFGDILRCNAALAADVGQHRLAQSWQILALVVNKELKARAESHRALRVSGKRAQQPSAPGHSSDGFRSHDNIHTTSEVKGLQGNLMAPLVSDYGSNMTTPMARPISNVSAELGKTGATAILDEGETFTLPVPAFAKQSPKKHHAVSDLSKLKDIPDTEEIDNSQQEYRDGHVSPNLKPGQSANHGVQTPPAAGFLDLDQHMSERRAAMSNYRAQPRPLLRLDDPFYIPRESLLVPSMGRHDSNESFQMLSASTDSSHRAASMGASFGSGRESDHSNSTPERSRMGTRAVSEENVHDSKSEMLFGADERPISHDNPALPQNVSDPSDLTTAGSGISVAPSSVVRPKNHKPPIVHAQDFDVPANPTESSPQQPSSAKDYFIPSDFEPPENAPPPKPWTATALIPPLITYHTSTLSDCQTPSFLFLYFLPYFCLPVPRPLIVSTLLSYHNQLISLSLYTQAAHLRHLCYPSYPEVYDHGTYGIASGGPWCTTCRKPNKGDKPGYCERCHNKWAPCPICNGDGPLASPHPANTDDDQSTDIHNPSASDSLWGWCQGCGHGGHIGCLRVWWDDPLMSEGGCATMGCLHDCVAGIRRDEVLRKAAEEKKAGMVEGDKWVVGESRAVGEARDMIAGGGGRGGRRRQGQGQTSAAGVGDGGQGPLSAGLGLGLTGRSHSGSGSVGKKVRLVVPEVQGDEDGRASASVP